MKPSVEQLWRKREEAEYPRLFGKLDRGIVTLDQTDLLERWLESPHAQADGIGPTGTCLGVLRSPAPAKRVAKSPDRGRSCVQGTHRPPHDGGPSKLHSLKGCTRRCVAVLHGGDGNPAR